MIFLHTGRCFSISFLYNEISSKKVSLQFMKAKK